MNALEVDIQWTDVDGLIVAGIGESAAAALAVAARCGARARGAEIVAALQLAARASARPEAS